MSENGLRDFYVDRRDFLRYSLATSVAVWAGMGTVSGMDEAEAAELFRVKAANPARFPQSVASGDPQSNGIVLWTRIASGAKGDVKVAYEVARASDTNFARPVLRGVAKTNKSRDYTLKVQLKRAELKPFTAYRYRFIFKGDASRPGQFKTLPAPGADVSKVRFGYISCQDYTNGYYNALYHLEREKIDFVVHLGDYTYETAPPPGESNSFQGGGPDDRRFQFPDGGEEELTLKDYRFGYKKYKSDRNLQRLHEKCAFIVVWDDHEFANDAHQTSAPDSGGTTEGNKKDPRRREFASRAWAEYSPAGVYYNPSKDPLNEIVIYRSFTFGNLMELVMTDQRLYRDGPPNGNELQDRYLTPGTGTEGEEAPGRTMLGDGTLGQDGLRRPPQLEYFLQKITRSPRRWKIWGNEVTFMQLKVANTAVEPAVAGTTIQSLEELFPGIQDFPAARNLNNPEGVYTTLDQWDGYQAERRGITRKIRDDKTFPGPAGVENFITLTGDIHSYIAGYIKFEYDDPSCVGENRPVGVELVCPSVTSSNLSEIATFGFGTAPAPDAGEFGAQVTANNPHIKFFNSNEHGYNVVEVTKDSILCTMFAIRAPVTAENPNGNGIREPNASRTTSEVLRRFRVPNGEVLLIDETNAVPVPLPC